MREALLTTRRAGRRLLPLLVVLLVAVAGCTDNLDAKTSLHVTDVVTGWFDAGIVNGKNKLVPSVTFRVKNVADGTIRSVQLNAVFHVVGDDQELGSMLVRGIDADGLGAGKSTEVFTLRSTLGYTGEQPRMQMLQHSAFKDARVELFAKHGGRQWVKLGEYKVDRQLLTQ